MTLILALGFTGSVDAASYSSAPNLREVNLGTATTCWASGEFPLPGAWGYFQSAADGRTTSLGGPDGINYRNMTCVHLRDALNGWRPDSSSNRALLADEVHLMAHEYGHATSNLRGEALNDEAAADRYANGPAFEEFAGRLGFGPYWRRLLRAAL